MTETQSTRWRVLTWNILGARQPNLAVVAEVIAGLSPDVVALQEARHHQAHAMARHLGWHVRWARKHYPYTPLVWWRAEGLAIMSPHPLTDVLRTTISPGVSTWVYRHRIVIAATATRADASLRLYGTHLSSDSADARIAQAQRVAALVARDGAPVIAVAGDLNAAGEVEVIREFNAVGLRDPGHDVTSPSIVPSRRIDYVLVPQGATVSDEITPGGGERWDQLSDHLPVLLEFTV